MTLQPKTTAFLLGTTATCLILANIACLVSQYYFGHDHLLGLVPLFDLNGEGNVPAVYSTILLFICFVLLCAIASAQLKLAQPYGAWLCLALLFLFLSIDEYVSLHERLIVPVRTALRFSGILYPAWVVPYGIAVLALGLVYARFVFRLPSIPQTLTIAAAFIYLTGAVGFECASNWYFVLCDARITLGYEILTTCEEGCEMFGVILFVYALMSYSEVLLGNAAIRVDQSGTRV